MKKVHLMFFETDLISKIYTGYFTSIKEPGGIENATHNTFPVIIFTKRTGKKRISDCSYFKYRIVLK
jgi:hypothetical protein